MAILIVINVFTTIPFLFIGMYFYNEDHKLRNNQLSKTTGKVCRYTHSRPPLPVVAYEVNGIRYTKRLKYSYIFNKVSPFTKNSISDFEGEVLRINANAFVYYSSIKEYYYLGKEINVYYDESKPKRSYVLRYAHNFIPTIFIIASITTFISICLVFGLVI